MFIVWNNMDLILSLFIVHFVAIHQLQWLRNFDFVSVVNVLKFEPTK